MNVLLSALTRVDIGKLVDPSINQLWIHFPLGEKRNNCLAPSVTILLNHITGFLLRLPIGEFCRLDPSFPCPVPSRHLQDNPTVVRLTRSPLDQLLAAVLRNCRPDALSLAVVGTRCICEAPRLARSLVRVDLLVPRELGSTEGRISTRTRIRARPASAGMSGLRSKSPQFWAQKKSGSPWVDNPYLCEGDSGRCLLARSRWSAVTIFPTWPRL